MMTLFDQDRDGETYDRKRDYARLNKQHLRIYIAMWGGGWWTLAQLSELTGDPEASVSARLRDFRKPRFGGHVIERKHYPGGLWEYRLVWNEDVPRPEVGK